MNFRFFLVRVRLVMLRHMIIGVVLAVGICIIVWIRLVELRLVWLVTVIRILSLVKVWLMRVSVVVWIMLLIRVRLVEVMLRFRLV